MFICFLVKGYSFTIYNVLFFSSYVLGKISDNQIIGAEEKDTNVGTSGSDAEEKDINVGTSGSDAEREKAILNNCLP